MNPSPRPDPFVGDRLNAADLYRRHEHEVMRRVLNAMAVWLDTTKALILHQPIPHAAVALLASGGARFKTITAAGEPQPDLNAAQAAFGVWSRAVAEHIDPAIAEAFGEAFQANARTADITSLPYQLQHMETVFDRLKIWPEGAFEELRPELLEAISEAESIDQVQDRIGRILNIDAPSRRIRADINDVDKRLAEIDALIADEDTPPETFPELRAERRELKAQRRELWGAHDESQREWQWLARRIARTEVQGAINAGTLAAAQAAESEGATGHYKAWLAAHDDAVRHTHVVADGQICRLADPFTVGGFPLQFPGEPGGPGHEVINCRCAMRILDEGEVQAELQGHRGGHGVAPGFARMGPDDPTQAAHAAEKVDLEDKGEVVDWPLVHEPERPTPVTPVSTDTEFSHLSDAELDAALSNALDDIQLYMRLDAEQQRRLNPTENAPAETDTAPEPAPVPEFKGRKIADLEAELEALTLDPDSVTDWDYYDRLANEVARRDEVNAKRREREAEKKEAKRQEQIDRYMELTEQGMDHEEATEEAFGITIEQQRKDAARDQLKAWGFTGSMQEQFRKWHIDEVIRDYQQAEDDCRGHMIKREHAAEFERKFKGEGYDVLWYSTEATARKYASNELLEWWDQHGRVTVEELKARLMDPSELGRMRGRRGDFLQ